MKGKYISESAISERHKTIKELEIHKNQFRSEN